jgi:exodeoxyribonuclease (lambda-induced)
VIHHTHPQGSPEWLAARRGVVTGSRFKDCRDFKAPTAAQKKEGATRGEPSSKLLCYAYDIARERCGGEAPAKFQTAAMRFGTEQEAAARRVYERRTRNLVEEVGFFTTDDRLFGLSPDGLVDDDGVLEIKTMVSSDTLFTAVALGDVSEYMDQCLGYLWLLGRKWVDLCLWVPDLGHMTIRRIERDEDAIELLGADLMAFAERVRHHESQLRQALEVAA